MSAEATFWAWSLRIRKAGTRPAPLKLILLCLADCHNSDTGRCDPSEKYISRFTGVDKKTIPKAIEVLEELGLITVKHRPGTSKQYELNFHRFPVPPREKGKPRPLVDIDAPEQLDIPQEGVTPITGIPNNGVTQERTSGIPVNGVGGNPLTGNEPRSNLEEEPTIVSVPDGTAANAALPVDNFTLADLSGVYLSDDPEREIYHYGVELLSRSGVLGSQAHNLLKMLINKHGEGRVLDALMVTILEMPRDPKPYLMAVATKIGSTIPNDWMPPPETLAELDALGMPSDVYRDSRDVFLVWFKEMGIRHNNFPALFVRWCMREWERVDRNSWAYKQRLAKSSGFGEVFQEPA